MGFESNGAGDVRLLSALSGGGSPCDHPGLPFRCDLEFLHVVPCVQTWGAKLVVLSEVEWFAFGPFGAEELTLDLRRMLTRRTSQGLERLIAEVGCPTDLRVELDGAADSIPRAARDGGADVLVIGRTHKCGLLG